jgi:hypothetical protein
MFVRGFCDRGSYEKITLSDVDAGAVRRPDAAKIAERMPAFNPDKSWQKAGDSKP